jgi:uncharacterized membrane protein
MAENNNNKLVAILSYIFFIGIIWYFVDKKVQNDFTKFHVKQALNYTIISFVVSFASTFFYFIPGFYYLISIVDLVLFVLWIIGIVYAAKEEKKEIPIIGSLAEKYLNF